MARDLLKKKINNASWYYRNKVRHIANTSARVEKLRRARMLRLLKLKGGKCGKCGYNRCVAALEFHHRDPSKKLFGVNLRAMTKSIAVIMAEVKKCDLLCSNCHREYHAGEWCFINGAVAERSKATVC